MAEAALAGADFFILTKRRCGANVLYMKIVLVRPNFESHIITPPLGIGYLSAYLKKNGVDSVIIDGLRDKLSQEEIFDKILSEKPDAVGITCLTAFYNKVVDLAKLVKKSNIKCIIGGVHPTFMPRETLSDSGADFVVCGEGELALLKLAKNNFVNENIRGVYSIDSLKDSIEINRAERIENLDDLPFPDWEQINPNSYPKAPHGAVVKNFPIGIIMTSRGCPYECAFCASPKFYGRSIRFRTPGNVVDEIKYLVDKFGIREVHFEDDNLTLRREHIVEICDLIIKNGIKISWACPNGIRADKVDDKLLDLMIMAGCYYFSYGIESANPQILQNIKKRETIESIERAIEMAAKKGISCQGFFIFGLPGETRETIKESIEFAKRSKLSRAQFLILDVLPGSELWDTLKGKFVPRWDKNSVREPEWIPDNLSREELLEAQSAALRQFYFRPKIFLAMLKFVNLKQIGYLFQRFKDYRIIKWPHN